MDYQSTKARVLAREIGSCQVREKKEGEIPAVADIPPVGCVHGRGALSFVSVPSACSTRRSCPHASSSLRQALPCGVLRA